MKVDQLGYVVVHSTDVEKWRHFGTQVVGLAGIDGPDDTLYLKADGRAYRMLVVPGDRDRLFACGWEVRDKKAFEEVRHALSVAGVATVDATPADLSSRKVQACSGSRIPLAILVRSIGGRFPISPASYRRSALLPS